MGVGVGVGVGGGRASEDDLDLAFVASFGKMNLCPTALSFLA